MAYYNPSQPPYAAYGQNPGYAPPQGQYYAPPAPPPGHSPYPQYSQGPAPTAYGAPPQGHYAPPTAPPSGHYPPPSGPPGQYAPQYPPPGAPPHGQYAPQYPPAHGQAPHPAPSGHPPSQFGGYNPSYSAPPAHSGPQQYTHAHDQLIYLGVPIPDPLAPPNTFTLPGFDPTPASEGVRRATKGFGTDEGALIQILAPLDGLQMAAVSQKFNASYGKGLTAVLESEAGGYFKEGLRGLSLGPIGYDVALLGSALDGIGTKENLLTELLMGRSNAELRHLTNAYNRSKGKDALLSKVKGDLSAKTERLFVMALSATRRPDNEPVDHLLVQQDVEKLYKAGQGKLGTDEITFCEILTNRSYPHITALTVAYPQKHHKSLPKVIKSEFSGHMKEALLHIVVGCKSKRIGYGLGVWRDMKLIEAAMKGMGTKDQQLVWRLCRGHWDRARFHQIKNAYREKYRKDLERRVDGETSGDYKKLMVRIAKGH
ncbi:hypothetical protein DL96DRAFT_1600037 [Flagelloscypha sp. PMI_526]|nr:hypothetical protein DL96DRAFT_1600037 [Flagelloscypha sp. PMI_526]